MPGMPFDIRYSATSTVLPSDTLIVYQSGGTYTYELLTTYIQSGGLTIAGLTTVIASLPTSEPGTSGVLWLNGGVVQLS